MGWLVRNGHSYFYLSQRVGKHVHKIYVGKGDVGRAAELTLASRKELRRQSRDWLRGAAERFAKMDVIDARLTVEIGAVLLARARIYMDCRLARRILRTQKGKIMEESIVENVLPMKEQPTWQQLTERASRGDREASEALIVMLNANPALVVRWGDLSNVALNCWLEILGNVAIAKEAIHIDVSNLVRSLRQFDDDPLEETMARRVGILRLQVLYFDSQVALAVHRTRGEQVFLAKRQKDAQQLYADATMALREYQGYLERRQAESGDVGTKASKPR